MFGPGWPTITTSNRLLEEWGKLLDDVPTAGAMLDRFLHQKEKFICVQGKDVLK